MEHKQHRITCDLSQRTDIYVENGILKYENITTEKLGLQQQWQLQVKCYVDDNQFMLSQQNINDVLLENILIDKAHVETNQVSTRGKQHVKMAPVLIDSGKNIGKKNQTSILQQALIYCDKRYQQMENKKKVSGGIMPMLLNTYAYVSNNNDDMQIKDIQFDLQFPCYGQKKLDGLRCVYVNGSLYSRGQKEFTNVPHICQQLNYLNEYIKHKYPKIRTNFDGELYIHGKTLQDMNRIVRNSNSDTKQLLYHIFDIDCIDIVSNEQAPIVFNDRVKILNDIKEKIYESNTINIRVLDTSIITDQCQLLVKLKEFVADGYEGIVLRAAHGLYEYSKNGKRSKHVLRCKPRLDVDVDVVGFTQGNGKDTGAIIWQCQFNNQQFDSVQNATLQDRQRQYRLMVDNLDMMDYIKHIPMLVEYNEMSETGVPLQSRGIIFRMDKSTIQVPEQIENILRQHNLI